MRRTFPQTSATRSVMNMVPLSCPLLLILIGLYGCRSENSPGSEEPGTESPSPPEADGLNRTLHASCEVRPSTKLPAGQPKIYGCVLFRQDGPDGELQALFRLRGLPHSDRRARAIHVHQYGDLSNGCDSAGGHYDPLGAPHPGHPGDFGNFLSRRGRIRESRSGGSATLFGDLSVLGRAVVIHERKDDLGRGGDAASLLHGNAGRRLACCVIGVSSPKPWELSLRRWRA